VTETITLGIIGKPVLHSLSPSLFESAFAETGVEGIYLRIAAASAPRAIEVAGEMGLDGYNVTAPFKERVVGHMDELAPSAARLLAVNTVVCRGGRRVGHNTDVTGARRLLEEHGAGVFGRTVFVIGTGGAAKAGVCAAAELGARTVVLGRDRARGASLARRFGAGFQVLDRAGEVVREDSLIMCCVPPGARALDDGVLGEGNAVIDASYIPSEAKASAIRAGSLYVSGAAWLLAQAREAFRLMTGRDAPEGSMERALGRGAGEPPTALWLLGMMGSGKSAVGRAAARMMGEPFVDTDRIVEELVGASAHEIFDRLGETRFREVERGVLERALARVGQGVVALGGGSTSDGDLARRIRTETCAVWLWASTGVCARRANGSPRPLLQGRDATGAIDDLLRERMRDYSRSARLVVDSGTGEVDDVARRICEEIRLARRR